jgi:multidrug efflux pump subunit AcrB
VEAPAERFNLTAAALREPQLTLFFILAVAIAGITAFFQLGQREDPDFTFRLMVVRAFWPGATAEQVDQQLTDRLERKLQELPFLARAISYSKEGEVLIRIELHDTVNAAETAQLWYQVRKKLNDVKSELPPEVIGPFFNDEFGDVFGSVYAFTGDGFTLAELRRIADDTRQQLLRLPDVAKIELIGVQPEKIFIEISPQKLAALGLDPNLIIDQLRAQNALLPAGAIESAAWRVPLRVDGQFDSVSAVQGLHLAVGGRTIRLGDIAQVQRGYEDPPITGMRYKGKPAIGLAVSMTPRGDVVKLGRNLRAAIARAQSDFPLGIEVGQVSDQPRIVEQAVGLFTSSLGEAILIVLAVSFITLGLRAGSVVALTIPFVIAATFLVMRLSGIDLHRISTGALIIALGLLVDDAMIAVEMMVRKIEEGLSRMQAATIAYSTTAFPMLTGTLITCSGFLPIATARSTTGEYTFGIFAVTTLALVISWFAAVLVTPLLGTWLLREHASPDGNTWWQRLLPQRWRVEPTATPGHHEVFDSVFYRALRASIEFAMRRRWLTLAVTVGLFLLGGAGMGLTEKQFFPTSNRAELIIELWLPEGSSYRATEHEARRLEAVLGRDPDLSSYVTYVGNGSPRFYLSLDQQLFRSNFAQVIALAPDLPAAQRALGRVRQALANDFPGVRGRVYQVPIGPPVNYPIQFRVMGDDVPALKQVADEVAAVLRQHPKTENVNIDWGDRVPVLRVEVDQAKARALGVSSLAISRTLAANLSGATIGQYRENDRLIDVVLRAPDNERADPGRLGELQVPTATGQYVALAQVASVGERMEEPILWRRNRTLTFTVRADLLAGVQAPDVSMQINPQLDPIRARMPSGVRIEVGGAYEENARAEASIAAGMPMVAFVVCALLMLQLRRFSAMVMVLATAPLGIVGVAAALLLFQKPFGFVAMLGVIALAGMIMRNTVILVDQIQHDIAAGTPHWEAIREAAVRRFRPITLTAAAAMLAMIPLTRDVLWGPMAYAIMGGLLVATMLTLYAVPALYAVIYARHQRAGGAVPAFAAQP